MSRKLEIFGRNTSSNVQTVMWAVAELGLDHVRHDVGGAFGQTDSPEFRAMNPMGLVPVARDGDLVLFESCAIVRYLGAQYGTERFWPADPIKRAKQDNWAEWSKTTLAKTVIYDVFWQLVRTPKADRDMEAVTAAAVNLDAYLRMAEKRLGESAYFGGDALCFADIVFGHVLYRYYTLDFDRAPNPTIENYYQRLTEREAYAEHVMVDYSSLRVE